MPHLPAPLDWWKGRAPTDRAIYEIATQSRLIAPLRPLLGEDIVLWGAAIAQKAPCVGHRWHTDVESAAPGGRTVSVWIGIRNAGRNSGLRFVAGSHRFGCSVQEALAGLGEQHEPVTDTLIADIARTKDRSASIVHTVAEDGEAVLFDGRAWHASSNDSATDTRTALLLQYASADTPIPMPAPSGFDWPFTFVENPRVPTILVSGSDRRCTNRLVPPPPPQADGLPMITIVARSVALPLAEDAVTRWRAYHQFRGPTRTLSDISCHISVLSTGHHPHPPHIHREEELLVVLDGAVEIELARDEHGTDGKRHALKPGMFSYYPAGQHHTIHNVGPQPATYLMFKWLGGAAGSEAPLPASIFKYEVAGALPDNRPIVQTLIFEQATHCLGKLHAHLTTLQPGAGYQAHVDAHDVAIILLSGEVETVGERVKPLGLIYYSAGELHGMKNVGSVPAVYLVFEFHSPAAIASQWAAAEAHRRKQEKKLRKRGVRGFVRKLFKAVKKLGR